MDPSAADTSPADSSAAARAGPRRPPLPALAVAAVMFLFLAAALPAIALGLHGTRGAYDEAAYHAPAIRSLARQWPRPDFVHFSSATTPGYHLVLALVLRYGGAGPRALRLAGALFTAGWLAAQAADAGRRLAAGAAVALCLPLVFSPYVFDSAVLNLPDNAAWWGVLAALLLALRPRIDARFYFAGGATMLALALTRQPGLWCAAPLLAGAWLGPPPTDGAGAAPTGRTTRVALASLAVTPAFLAVAWFYRLWHGPVPPAFRDTNGAGANPAVPAAALTVLGALGVFYLGFLAPRWPAVRRAWPALAAAALAGVLIGALPRTSYDQRAGRWSGVWNLARHLPTFAGRSPLLVAGSALGVLTLAAWAAALPRRDRLVFLAAWAAFLAANTASHDAFQRYYEPFALMSLALAAARVGAAARAAGTDATARAARESPVWAAAGPAALAAILAALSASNLRQGCYPSTAAGGANPGRSRDVSTCGDGRPAPGAADRRPC